MGEKEADILGGWKSWRAMPPCVIFHSVTAKDLDISDMEVYDFPPLFRAPKY